MATKKARKKAKPAKKKATKKKVKKLSKIEALERYVRSLESRLRKYEKNRFVGPLQQGKKRKKPSKAQLEKVRSSLKLFLEGAKRALEGDNVASHYRSHENSDGSIDAELQVPLEDSGDVDGTFIEIEDAGDWNSLSEFWIMIGLNVSAEQITGSPTLDRRPNRAWTNPVRGNRAGAAFFTARETVVKKLRDLGGEFNKIVIRIFWSPDNDRMHRPG